MSPQGIRLRLVIRRHAVPDVKLVWPCADTQDLTIAKLLAQVNEVVPLEAGDWGLEDYAVELTDGRGESFECLHFQTVGNIFKEDDQVLIRSLLTEDLRRRRLSGRHQITTDGRHLVDGIPFGRAWLRAPRDRPPPSLPPRKRARITYDQDVDDEQPESDEDETEGRLLLDGPELDEDTAGAAALFDDADLDADNEDEDDEDDADFTPADNGQDGSSPSEDEDADDEALEGASEPEDDEEDNIVAKIRRELEALKSSRGVSKPKLDAVSALQKAFPLTPISIIEAEFQRRGDSVHKTYRALSESNGPSLGFYETIKLVGSNPTKNPPPRASEGHATTSETLGNPARPLIQELESSEPTPNRSKVTAPTLNVSASTNALGVESVETSSSGSSSDSDPNPGSEDSSSSDSEKTSEASSDDSASEEEDDGGSPIAPIAESNGAQGTSSDSGSSSDDSSSAGSHADESAGGANVGGAADASPSESSSEDSSDDSDSSSDESDSSGAQKVPSKPSGTATQTVSLPFTNISLDDATVPPGQGLKRTRQRNARRREAKRAQLLNGTEPTAEGANADDSLDAQLEARKKALLNSFGNDTPDKAQKKGDQGGDEVAAHAENAEIQHGSAQKTPQDTTASPDQGSAPRRARMDLGAGRRLLFGALGLKNPKTKADEEKIKQGLMKDVRPLPNLRTETPAQDEARANEDVADDIDDPESWRDKVNYRAVECCHEGMVLNEPPFPFVQRWDPQQQFGSMRKRKRSSHNFYDESYYDDDSRTYDEEVVDKPSSKKRKSRQRKSNWVDGTHEGAADEDLVLDYDDKPANKSAGGSQFTDVDDLPSLPSDLSVLPVLEAGAATPGMVITWKQLLLSRATRWEPQIGSVTGLVVTGSDEDTLRVVLAKRDREERLFDEETGKRIYDKFEAPNSDDDDGGLDDGYRDVAWGEMMDPRVVQQAATPAVPGTAAGIALEPVNEDPAQSAGTTMEDPKHVVSSKIDESSGTVSIPSGQRLPHLDPPITDDPPTDVSNDRNVARGPAIIDGTNTPDEQVHEASPAPASPAQGTPLEGSQGNDDADAALDVLDPNVLGLQPEALGTDFGQGYSHVNPDAEYPMLTIPSSFGSPTSGRQPQAHDDDSLDQAADSVIPETGPPALEATPQPDNAQPAVGSSSPLPSLEEIFHTAATTRQTQSPGKSHMTGRSVHAGSDTAYEEAMRRLDEGQESERSPDKTKPIRNLFPNATQPSPSLGAGEQGSPRPRRKTRARRTSPFVVPPGSQVISLESSPAPARPAEEYAEDDIDGTYGEDSLLPKGPGWVKKGRRTSATGKEARGRAKNVPAGTAKRGRPRKTSAN